MHELVAQLGGLDIAMRIEGEQLARSVEQTLKPYLQSGVSARHILSFRHAKEPPQRGGPFHRSSASLAQRFDGNGTGVTEVLAVLRDEAPPFRCPSGVLDTLRLALEYWLPGHDGFVLHAASLPCPRGGLVAFGDSGAGKSTLSKLVGRAYTDEGSILRRDSSSWQMYATPFCGDYTGPATTGHQQVDLVARLHHAPAHVVETLPRREALQQILRQCVQIERDRAQVARLLQLVEQFVRDLPVVSFGFAPTADAVDVLFDLTLRNS